MHRNAQSKLQAKPAVLTPSFLRHEAQHPGWRAGIERQRLLRLRVLLTSRSVVASGLCDQSLNSMRRMKTILPPSLRTMLRPRMPSPLASKLSVPLTPRRS
jgi:hypothetical protein